MLNSIEEFLQIEVNHDIATLGHIALGLGYGPMSRAPRPETVAVLGKRRVPMRLENLQQRLLDQSIDDTRHAEFSDLKLPRFRGDPTSCGGGFHDAEDKTTLSP